MIGPAARRLARRARLLPLAACAALALLLALPAAAALGASWSDMGMGGAPSPSPSAGPHPTIQVWIPSGARLGQVLQVRALLVDPDGKPIPAATLTFTSPATWAGAEEYSGDMYLGTAETNDVGVAVLSVRMTRSGAITIAAHFAGSDELKAVDGQAKLDVAGTGQLYSPQAGITVPGVGPWLLITVIAALYLLYMVVASRVFAISHSPLAARGRPAVAQAQAAAATQVGPGYGRRDFFGRVAVPGLIGAVAAALGIGLDTIVHRSPHTHGNLLRYTTRSSYRRTAFQRVGAARPTPDLPPVLSRPVTFEADVRPILMRRAGPHVVLPRNQPPPKGIRLDDYDGIASYEDLVVPGKPEESGIVSVLLDPAMRMPPSLPSLPAEEIQIIVSWIAQGAKKS